jgi:phospholipase C
MSSWRYQTVGDLTSALPNMKAPVSKKPKLAPTSPSIKRPPIKTECVADQLVELNPLTSPYPIPEPQTMSTQGPQTFTPTPR